MLLHLSLNGIITIRKQPLHIYIWMSLEKKESSAVKCRRMKGIEKLFQNRQQPNFTTSLRNHFFSHRNDIFPTIWKGQEIEFFFMFFNNVDESSVIWSCPPSIENLSPLPPLLGGVLIIKWSTRNSKIVLMMSVQRSLYYIMGCLAGVIITPEDGNMLIKGEGLAHQVPLSGRPCVLLHCMMLRHQSDKWPHYTHMHHQEGLSHPILNEKRIG